jgi:hypothetical protein
MPVTRTLPTLSVEQYDAIDKIYDAYMALNTADVSSVYGQEDGYNRLADAARYVLRQYGLTPMEARAVWSVMVDGASGAEYSVKLVRNAEQHGGLTRLANLAY